MAKKTYKNTTDQTLDLMGVGVVKPGETVETDVEVNNPNFKEVKVNTKKTK